MPPLVSWNIRSVLCALTLGCVVLVQISTTQSTSLPFNATCDTQGNITVDRAPNQNVTVLLKVPNTACSPNETNSSIVYGEECQENGVLTLTLKKMDDIITNLGDIYRFMCHIVNGTDRNLTALAPMSQDSSSSKPVSIPGVVGKLDMVLQTTATFDQYAGGEGVTTLEIGQTDVSLILRHNKPSNWTQSFVLFPVTCAGMSASEHDLKYEFWNIQRPRGQCNEDERIIQNFTANVSSQSWDLTHSGFLPFEFVRKPSGRVLLQCSVLLCPSDSADEWTKKSPSPALQHCAEVYKAYTDTCEGKFDEEKPAPPVAEDSRRRRRRQAEQGRQLVHNAVLTTSFVVTQPRPLDLMSGAAVTSPKAAIVVVAMAVVTQIF